MNLSQKDAYTQANTHYQTQQNQSDTPKKPKNKNLKPRNTLRGEIEELGKQLP